MARKLQIESLSAHTANSVCSVIESPDFDFETLRRYCERNAPMAVAVARVRRTAQREEAGAVREHAKPIEAQLSMERERREAAEREVATLTYRLADETANNDALKRALETTR